MANDPNKLLNDFVKKLTKRFSTKEAPRGAAIPEPKPQPDVGPNDMVIRTSRDRVLVVVRPNGELEFGPDYTPDEAAELFWATMALKRVGSEARLQLLARMENLITSIGQADIEHEKARRDLSELEARILREGESEELTAELETVNTRMLRTNRVLEQRVHSTIEFGRSLVENPELPRPNRTFQEPN